MTGQVEGVRADGQRVRVVRSRQVPDQVVDGAVDRVPVHRRGPLVLQERDQRVGGEREPAGRAALHLRVADLAHLGEAAVVGLVVGQPLETVDDHLLLDRYVRDGLPERFHDVRGQPGNGRRKTKRKFGDFFSGGAGSKQKVQRSTPGAEKSEIV